MSKQPAKRKKTSEDDAGSGMNILANLDISDKSITPKIVAKALLSLLPDDATKQHSSAKKLAKAFSLVNAELDARSNKLAVQNVHVGENQPIRFQFQGSVGSDMDEKMSASSITTTTIDMPEVCFVKVLQYLDGREITNISLVSKVWSSVSKSPIVWEDGVDMSRFNLDKKLNMTSLLKLLQRPQFSRLKGLALPYKIKLGKNSVKQLAKSLPHLELFDPGYYSQNTKCTDNDLLAATEYFTELNSLRTDMSKVTSSGIGAAVRAMGTQLVDLRVFGDTIASHYLSEMTMETITSCCPNLKYFAYRACGTTLYYDPHLDGVTGECIIRLVDGCRRLETLELDKAYHVKQSHFVQIANTVSNKLNEFALRRIKAVGYSGVNPSGTIDKDVEDPFNIREVLRPYTFLQVEDKFVHPRLEKGIMFWSKYGDDRVKRDRSKMTFAFSNAAKEEMTERFENKIGSEAAAVRKQLAGSLARGFPGQPE